MCIRDSGVDTVSVLLDRMADALPEDVRAESHDMGHSFKWYLAVRVVFKKLVSDRKLEQPGVFRSRMQLVLTTAEDAEYVNEEYTECVEKCSKRFRRLLEKVADGWSRTRS